MPVPLGCAAGIAAATGFTGVGAWRIKTFLERIRAYKNKAKAGAQPAPPDLAIQGAEAEHAQELSWFVIDDQVMGGGSSSTLTMNEGWASPIMLGSVPQSIEFAGTINTEGGGFSSCRTLGDELPLGLPADTTAIEVTAILDARMYKLMLMTGDSWSMGLPSWAHDFRGEPGQRQSWVLPLASFVPSIRGRKVKGAVLNPASITGIGLSLSLYDMQGEDNIYFGDGPFKIELQGLRIIQVPLRSS